MESKMLSFPEGKTDYQIDNEDGEKTTIRLEKWVADILQEELEDVHEFVQRTYVKIAQKIPDLGRTKKGDAVREFAGAVVENKYQKTMKKQLGWSWNEFYSALENKE